MAVQMRTGAGTDLIQTNAAQVSRKNAQGTQNELSAGGGFKNFLDGSKNLSSVKNSQNMGSQVKQQSAQTAPKDGTVSVSDDVRRVVEELREDKRFEKALEALDRAIGSEELESSVVSESISESVPENVKELAQKVLDGEIDIKDIPDDISAEELMKELIAIMMQQRLYPEKDDEQAPKLFDPATAAVNEQNLNRDTTDRLISELYKLIEKHNEDKDEENVTILDGISEPTDADETLASIATGELQAEQQAEEGAFDRIIDNMAETAEAAAEVKAVEAVEAVETVKPTESMETVKAEPIVPVMTTEPTEPVTTAEPTEPVMTTEPTEPVTTAEPTEPVMTAEPTEPVMAAEPTEPVTTTEPTEPVMTTEPTEPVMIAQPTEPAKAAEPTETVKAAEPAEVIKTIEPGESAELSETAAANVKSTPTVRTQSDLENSQNAAPEEAVQPVKAPEQGAQTDSSQMQFGGQAQKTEQIDTRVDEGELDKVVESFTVKETNVSEPAKTEAPVKASVTTAPQPRVQNASEELEMLKNAKLGKKEPETDSVPTQTANPLTSDQPIVFTRTDGTKVEVNPSEIVDQTARIIEAAIKETQQQSEYSLILNPEELGRITVKLIKAADGAVSVTIAAENAHTQRVLEQHSELMQSNLRANGTNLASWQTVNESRQETYAQDYNGSSKNPYFRRDDAQHTDEDNTDTTFADIIAAM